MYNEDDTFRILSRPSIYEMVGLYKQFKLGRGVYDTRMNIVFVNKYGWDWVEFLTAAKAESINTSV